MNSTIVGIILLSVCNNEIVLIIVRIFMKKSLYGFLVFMSIFSMNSALFSQAEVQGGQSSFVVDTSGQDRINVIMSHINHDKVPGNTASVDCVQGANIGKDLDLQEVAKFFDCKTVMGHSFLVETLQKPVSPTDQTGIVELRRNAIKQLVDNPELKSQVEELLEAAIEQEKTVSELMSNTFKNSNCPEIESLKKLKEEKHWLYNWCNFSIKNEAFRTCGMVSEFVSLPQNIALPFVLGSMAYDDTYRFKCLDIINTRFSPPLNLSSDFCAKASVYLGVTSAIGIYVLYDSCVKAGEKRIKIRALNQLVRTAESIADVLESFDVESQFEVRLTANDTGNLAVKGLKNSRYNDEVNYCFSTAAVHTFLYKLYDNDTQLAQVFASIAEIDAYNAIATKILEGQSSERKFCFAERIDSIKPQVRSESFWNVLVPNAVVNSMSMDENVILTGPNAGGKTTSIRANLQNIILAQTYGVAAAESFEYTPFDVILSYLNISDDLINGYSLYVSEVNRAKELLENLRSLNPGQKLFFALDELFTGTAAEQGEKCAYDFIKRTAEFDQALFIYATHFDKLKDLGNQNIGLMNYKVDAPTKNAHNKLVYPFTLSAGSSDVNVAMEIAKEANLFD